MTSRFHTVKAQPTFVLFPLGKKRFALPAEKVAELAKPDELQSFPHTTRNLTGVLVRRGEIIPVCDIAPVVMGPDSPARRFYLIAKRKFDSATELTALPVSGECELRSTEPVAVAGKLPDYVVNLLSLEDEIVEVLDLEQVVIAEPQREVRS